jgi:hypothetical protein
VYTFIGEGGIGYAVGVGVGGKVFRQEKHGRYAEVGVTRVRAGLPIFLVY